MDFITRIANSVYFAPRYHRIERYATHAAEIQEQVLKRLVSKAVSTEWGKKYDFATIKDYKQFSERLPIQTYEEVKPWVERIRQGEENLLWPGKTIWFAKSSGTTNDKSKFIPVTSDSIQDTHYCGGKDAVALYMHINPNSRFSKASDRSRQSAASFPRPSRSARSASTSIWITRKACSSGVATGGSTEKAVELSHPESFP